LPASASARGWQESVWTISRRLLPLSNPLGSDDRVEQLKPHRLGQLIEAHVQLAWPHDTERFARGQQRRAPGPSRQEPASGLGSRPMVEDDKNAALTGQLTKQR
jgi:hypothetical protein